MYILDHVNLPIQMNLSDILLKSEMVLVTAKVCNMYTLTFCMECCKNTLSFECISALTYDDYLDKLKQLNITIKR